MVYLVGCSPDKVREKKCLDIVLSPLQVSGPVFYSLASWLTVYKYGNVHRDHFPSWSTCTQGWKNSFSFADAVLGTLSSTAASTESCLSRNSVFLVRTSALEDLHFKSVLIAPLDQTDGSDKLLEESAAAGDLTCTTTSLVTVEGEP
jgi:hypothetical protein